MITEDFVSYEVAKLLKEKGFNEPCECAYSAEGQYLLSCYKGIADRRIKNDETLDFSYSSTAPTHEMAMAWLRKMYNIYYEIKLLLGENAEKYGRLQLGIYQLNSLETYVWKGWIYADTYVELYENYIKYCLENLI